WNVDKDITAQDETVGWTLGGADLQEIAGGDLDGDGVAEIVIREESGWWDQKDDVLHIFSPQAQQIVSSQSVPGHSIDIAVGDTDDDGIAEVAVLRSDQVFELRRLGGSGSLDLLYEHSLDVGDSGSRITMFDRDGDSPAGKLTDGPVLVPGDV